MTRKLRTIMAVLLVLMMSFTAVPAVLAEEVPTLTIFIEEVVTIEDIETNHATLWLQEQLGCELEFVIAPTGSAEEKMNILLNSGDYPDIFYRAIPNENLYGIEAGILIDLTEYAADPEIMPNWQWVKEIRPNLEAQIKAVDGKIYSMPGYTECWHCQYSTKMFYNKAILEELNIEVPKTTEDFYNACVAFKAAYPDGVAISGAAGDNNPVSFLMNAFVYWPNGNKLGITNHQGTMETIVNTPEYKEGMAWLNKLYEEGLLYEGSFTMDGNQMKALLASDTPCLFWSAYHNVAYVDGAATPELYANQYPLEPLIGPAGKQYTTYTIPAPYQGVAITDKCEYPELAAKFIDLHYSPEGFWNTNEGREGEEWNWCVNGEMSVEGFPAVADRTGPYITDVQNVKWEPNALQMQIPETCASSFDAAAYDQTNPADGAKWRSMMTTELYLPHYQDEYQSTTPLKFTADEEEELSMISVSLENYIAESNVSFITGKLDIDSADWDSFVASVESIGMPTALELYQAAYDRVN